MKSKAVIPALATAFMMFALPLAVTVQTDFSAGRQPSVNSYQDQDSKADFGLSVRLQTAEAQTEGTPTPAPTPAEAGAPAEPTFLDAILKALGESSMIVAGLIMVFEFLFRVFPSKKPLSVLVPVRYTCVGLAAIFKFLGDISTQLINVANNTQKPV